MAQNYMNKKELPVLLLTGYLGSGKTTLLNKILSNRRGVRFAVIVNDIGEVNIDADLIQKEGIVNQKDDNLIALQNGCICCTLKTDLIEQLHGIAVTGKFDYIVIEASGICEPEPIARTICSIPSIYPTLAKDAPVRLDSIVTVVDALRMRDEFNLGQDLIRGDIDEEDIQSLVIQQIEFCNVILLNKASEISDREREQVTGILKALQPEARILPCDYGEVDFDLFLNSGTFDFEKVATSATWIKEVEGHHEHEHEHEHNEEGEAEEYGIGTFVYCRRQPLDINRFDNFVAKKWPSTVIRTKGICYFSEEFNTCYLFEQAGKQFSMRNVGDWYATMPASELNALLEREPNLALDWDDIYGDRMQKLVFIGQKMDRSAIEAELDKCLVE